MAIDILAALDAEQVAKLNKTIPDFQPGDTVQVNVKVKEGERSRIQAYEGVCIARNGGGLQESFTVRKISYGEGVERVFPIYSRWWTASLLCVAVLCVVPSSITCAIVAASQRVSSSARARP